MAGPEPRDGGVSVSLGLQGCGERMWCEAAWGRSVPVGGCLPWHQGALECQLPGVLLGIHWAPAGRQASSLGLEGSICRGSAEPGVAWDRVTADRARQGLLVLMLGWHRGGWWGIPGGHTEEVRLFGLCSWCCHPPGVEKSCLDCDLARPVLSLPPREPGLGVDRPEPDRCRPLGWAPWRKESHSFEELLLSSVPRACS